MNLELALACAEVKTSHLAYLVSDSSVRVTHLLEKVESLYQRLQK